MKTNRLSTLSASSKTYPVRNSRALFAPNHWWTNTAKAMAKPIQKALMSKACLKGTTRCLRLTTVRSRNNKTRMAALKTTQNQMCMDDLAADRAHDEISHAAIISVQSSVPERYLCLRDR